MAFSTRGTYTWISCVLLLVFIALRIDGRLEWNWFYVFTPAWVYDTIMLLYIAAQAVTEVKRRPTNRLFIILTRLWDSLAVTNKLLFQVFLCIKLQGVLPGLHIHHVCVPLWALLLQISASLIFRIYVHERAADSTLPGGRRSL